LKNGGDKTKGKKKRGVKNPKKDRIHRKELSKNEGNRKRIDKKKKMLIDWTKKKI